MSEGKPNAGVLFAFTSWRVGAVALLSFSSGLPLGLVWIAIPAWLKVVGFDIQTVALITLAQVPWTLKFLWSPLMDRYVPPLLGRRRGWVVVMQLALAATFLHRGWSEGPALVWNFSDDGLRGAARLVAPGGL